jgi:hypothetical protein
MAYNEGASSGNLVLIQKQTASASAEIDFTSGITGYDIYYLSFYDIVCSAVTADLFLQFSVDGGATYETTNYLENGCAAYNSSINSFQNIVTGYQIGWSLNSSGNPLRGNAKLYSLNDGANSKGIIYEVVNQSNALTGNVSRNVGGLFENASVVNALRFIPASGTITTGTFKLYGVQN